MNTFSFVGTLSTIKETKNFVPIEHREFNSGWTNTNVRFNCISGTNRIMCMIQGGKWKKDADNVIKTFSKSVYDGDKLVTKGEKIEIKWAKRFDKDQVDKVANFRKYVVDTEIPNVRYKLREAVKAFENGSITDELMKEVGYDNLDDAKAALEKSEAKRKEFISEYDFAEHMIKVLKSDKFKKTLFRISGNYEVQYNADKNTYYTNYHVNRVTAANDDTELSTKLNVDFFFGEDCFDDSDFEETEKAIISGWIQYYDSSLKVNGFKPMVVTVRETERKTGNLKKKFNAEGDEIKQISLVCNVIDGAERKEITMDMLSEEQREDIECGLLEFKDVVRELGGNVFGDRISEIRFLKLGSSVGVQETTYEIEDMIPAKAKDEDADDEDENDDTDIFSDDDEL